MALNVKKMKGGNGKKFTPQDPVEVGTYPARIAQIIDLGLQPQSERERKKYGEKAPHQKIQITYELVDEFMKDEDGNDIEDKPRWLSERIKLYPLTSDRATSTKRYKAIDPNEDYDGDFTQLLGLPVMVTVTQYEGTNGLMNGIGDVSAMRPRDAAKCPELVNEAKLFTLEEPDLEVFNSFPEFLQNIIKENVEFPGSVLQNLLEGGTPEEEPEEEEAPKPKKKRVVKEPEPEDEDEEDVPW